MEKKDTKTFEFTDYEYNLILTALRTASVQCAYEYDSDSEFDMNALADRMMSDGKYVPDYYGIRPKINGRLFRDEN